MEKQRKIRHIKFFSGLLKAFCGLLVFSSVVPAFSQQRLTYNIIKELTVNPVNQTNFSGTDCAFELKVPYIKSDLVQAQIPDLPNGVTFVSLRRSEYSDDGKESGTKIELWLNFADAGTYRLRSLHVYINSRLYYLPFNPIVISENPRNILPQLVVSFENGTELINQRRGKQLAVAPFSVVAGKPAKFTVSLKYAVQIISYSWTVPKNALVREIEQYDITKGTLRSSEFSEEKIPVSTFEWEPLYGGNLSLPDLKIIATSYNGTRVELKLPETLIPVIENKVVEKNYNDASSYFGYAFTKRASTTKSSVKNPVSAEDCEAIAELRSIERHSVPFTGNYRKRKAFENEKGIQDGAVEPSYFWLWCSLSLMLIFAVLDLISGFTKKLFGILASSGLFLVFFVGVIISVVQVSRTYAVFKGGSISPVPESTVMAVASIESGKRVLIEQKAGNWIFVRYGTSGGWVTEDNVIFIDK